MKEFNEMTKKEKEDFLSMDLIERLIRLEQRVSASFGNFVHYSETEYFKSLSGTNKNSFIKYLKSNKRKKYVLLFLFSLFALFSLLFRGNISGNVVSDVISFSDYFPSLIFFTLLFIFILVILITLYFKTKKEKRFKRYFGLIERIYSLKTKK